MVFPAMTGSSIRLLAHPRFLWLRYAVALALVATLVTFDHFNAEKAAMQAHADAETLNRTGRQRMLSQRIVYLADEILEEPDVETPVLTGKLAENIDQFEQTHLMLVASDAMSAAERDIYFGDCDSCGLDALVRSFIADARLVMGGTDVESRFAALARLEDVGIGAVLDRLDAATGTFTEDTRNDLVGLVHVDRNYYLLAMILLVIEALLIFLPAQLSLNRYVRDKQADIRELRESNSKLARARADFLTVMSHEIRTPLNGMMGVLQLLQRSKLPRESAELVDMGRQSGEHLTGLVTDILEMSSLQVGKSVLEVRPFNLVQTISGAVQAHRVSAAHKNLRLEATFNCDQIPLFLGDEAKLRQIVSNLIGNAVKFTLRGHVQVSVTCVPVEATNTAKIRIDVCDTGIGIATDELARLFEPFTQVEDPYRRHFGGMGLGLAICQSLATLMNAQLTAHSEPRKGSTFSLELSLPVHGAADLPSLSDPLSPRGKLLAGKKVLVAEDLDLQSKILGRLLVDRWHMDTVFVKNGLEAVEQCSRQQFDIILMDIQMPIMGGEEAVWQIREMDGYENTPVVAITSNVSHEDFADYRRRGMCYCLSKPINWHELKKVLLATLVDADPQETGIVAAFPDWVADATQKFLASRARDEGVPHLTADLKQLKASIVVICDQLDMARNHPSQIVGLCQKLRDIDDQYGFEFMTPFARYLEARVGSPLDIQNMSIEIQQKMNELLDSLMDDDMI